MRLLALILFLLPAVMNARAERTNYFCVVCGKGPLTGQVWLHRRGAICVDCEKLPGRCTICGLPVKAGDGHIKTGDGRLICKFDKDSVILTADQARELFEQTRDAVVDLYGRTFVLKDPAVTVTLFDVDYWSEKGGSGGLHKYGFASTRQTPDGHSTHEVVMLSGRPREEMTAVAAHEYTHLWIAENCPAGHRIEGNTEEAICELTAYKLMEKMRLPEAQKRILANSYTHGRIKDLVAVEREGGTDYVLNWVKTSKAGSFDVNASLEPLAGSPPAAPFVPPPRPLPEGLTFSGLMSFGQAPLAVINGQEFAAGDQKVIKLKTRAALVHCLQLHGDEISIEVDGQPLTLERGQEKKLP